MNILVLYHSKTGRTKALAESVAKGVERVTNVTAFLRSVEDVRKSDFLAADGVIAGSPVYFGGMAAELKSVLDRFIGTRSSMAGKVGAAFASGNHHTGGKETTLLSILRSLLIYGMVVTGDPLYTGGHYGIACAGAPSDSSHEEAARFGEHVARLVARLGCPESRSEEVAP